MENITAQALQLKKEHAVLMLRNIQIFKEFLDGATFNELGKKHRLAMTVASQFSAAYHVCYNIRYCILEMISEENLSVPAVRELDALPTAKDQWHLLVDQLAEQYRPLIDTAPLISAEADAMGREHIARMELTPGYYD